MMITKDTVEEVLDKADDAYKILLNLSQQNYDVNNNKVGVNRYQVNWIDVNSIHKDESNPNAMYEHEFNALEG